MPSPRRVTREAIVSEAMKIVGRAGAPAVTFQAIASALGVSKQAIIYWYPTKWELVADVCLPLIRQEADALLPPVAVAESAEQAIGRFVRAFAQHYLTRLSQFRIMYLLEPLGATEPNAPDQQAALAPIHRITSSIYSALEAKIAADPDFLSEVSPRRVAVAVHMAAVGLVTMFAAADALGDPMVHKPDDMIDALVALVTQQQKVETPKRRARA